MFVVAGLVALAASGAGQNSEATSGIGGMPHVHSFWKAALDRQSDSKDERGHFTPPWPWTCGFLRIAFSKRPFTARTATVVPLGISLPTLMVKVAEVNEWRGGCDGEANRISWEGVIAVERSDYLNAPTLPDHLAQSPFEAVIIYPAVRFAKTSKSGAVTGRMCPGQLAKERNRIGSPPHTRDLAIAGVSSSGSGSGLSGLR
jgi:hypothetical protein